MMPRRALGWSLFFLPAIACESGTPTAASATDAGILCQDNFDCPLDQSCFEGHCQASAATQCQSTFDCRGAEVCAAGVCRLPQLVGAPDAGQAGGADGGTQDSGDKLPYGAVCQQASDCSSELCLGPTGASFGRCTWSCAHDQECAYPDECLEVSPGTRLCGYAEAQQGLPTGAPCPNPTDSCASGLCLQLSSQTNVCTERCELSACPATMSCQPADDGQGGTAMVCTPGAGKSYGEACARGSECASSLCVGASGAGQCTAYCSGSGSCPSGASCVAVDDGAGGQAQVCVLAGAGSSQGGFGASCTAASDCQSGRCLNDVRLGQAFCTMDCFFDSDCSAITGLSCVTLLSGHRVCGPR